MPFVVQGGYRGPLGSFFYTHKVLLAPMAGVSDIVFRRINRSFGADLTYTEMVSAKGLSYANDKTRHLLDLDESEDLAAVQLFGHEPETMAAQAAWVEEQLGERLAYIDINMGCPARKIVTKGDGSALMKEPELAARIVEATSKAVQHPVTVKFRRGYEVGNETCVEFAKRLEQAGAAACAVHGRFAMQLYTGSASWEAIERVVRAVSVPVIGNGDVRDGESARRLFAQTGCAAVMIGRAAQGNPWVFQCVKAALEDMPFTTPGTEARIAAARTHARMLDDLQGNHAIVKMRKHAMWYVAGLPGASLARSRFNECNTLADFERVFDQLEAYGKESR